MVPEIYIRAVTWHVSVSTAGESFVWYHSHMTWLDKQFCQTFFNVIFFPPRQRLYCRRYHSKGSWVKGHLSSLLKAAESFRNVQKRLALYLDTSKTSLLHLSPGSCCNQWKRVGTFGSVIQPILRYGSQVYGIMALSLIACIMQKSVATLFQRKSTFIDNRASDWQG